jgi:hypothetical protein
MKLESLIDHTFNLKGVTKKRIRTCGFGEGKKEEMKSGV